MKIFCKEVKILTYYDLEGEYILFPENPLHNKVFENINVNIKNRIVEILNAKYEEQVIYIEGEEPIECELINKFMDKDTLVLEICQDWG